MSREIIDISVMLQKGMVTWPGDPVFTMDHHLSIPEGDTCNVSKLSMGVHTGTHIDAPKHFFPEGTAVDKLLLEECVGECLVVSVENHPVVTAELLSQTVTEKCTRLLIKTDNSKLWAQGGKFNKDFVPLDEGAARFLVSHGIRLVGVDYLSVEGFYAEEGNPVHKTLLSKDVIILEGCDLSEVAPGSYHLMALPLKIAESDGAPCRATLEKVEALG
jgi:arylformamidase